MKFAAFNGKVLKAWITGASHSPSICLELEGLPPGLTVDTEDIRLLLKRRAPGQHAGETSRHEDDEFTVTGGVKPGVLQHDAATAGVTVSPGIPEDTCPDTARPDDSPVFLTDGDTFSVTVKNKDVRKSDYRAQHLIPRPGHADYTAWLKYGFDHDMSGGGEFSGRMTVLLCIAGAVCRRALSDLDIHIGAHALSVHGVYDTGFMQRPPDEKLLRELSQSAVPVIDKEAGERMLEEIKKAAAAGDSAGGIVECAAVGFPSCIGGPMAEGTEGRLSGALFAVPAVKAVSFGEGFNSSLIYGSENNDAYMLNEDGRICTKTNHCGGILGGITDGMPLIFQAVMKPVPSVSVCQQSVDMKTLREVPLKISGRHDACIVFRVVPVIEAVCALSLYDMLLENYKTVHGNCT